jgi:Site-specific DNA methylase
MAPISIETGFDMRQRADLDRAKDRIRKEDPDVIIEAWPCHPYSMLQNLSATTPKGKRRLRALQLEFQPLIEFCDWCAKRQWRRGKIYVGENPKTSKAWRMKATELMREKGYLVDIDKCAFD